MTEVITQAQPEIETRAFPVIELRVSRSEGEPPKIKGHAAVFDKLSEDLGGFREKIAPGAFARTIGKADVRALFNHDANYILGRNKAGTLILAEDQKGLAIDITPPDTSVARDLMVSIDRGDIDQMSFAFRVHGKKGEQWQVDGQDVPMEKLWDKMYDGKKHDIVRTLLDVDLFDVSPVTYPAYPQTDVKIRDYIKALRQADAALDPPGPFPQEGAEASLAKQLLNYGFPGK